MEMFMEYVWAFVIGGAICLVGQLLIDLTKLTPAKILVTYVISGVVLGACGLYEPLVDFAGAGAYRLRLSAFQGCEKSRYGGRLAGSLYGRLHRLCRRTYGGGGVRLNRRALL